MVSAVSRTKVFTESVEESGDTARESAGSSVLGRVSDKESENGEGSSREDVSSSTGIDGDTLKASVGAFGV